MPAKVVVAAVLGTVLEWYDFAIYAALAVVIGRLFFPASTPTTSLLIALATYAVGFVCRPLGAIVFGRLGDRAGRRGMLAITMVVVGAASLLIGLLPTYASVGMLAPALLVALRMAQGLAVGAEWTGGATFLLEHARTGRRGLFGGILQAATVAGFLLGTGVAALIVHVVPDAVVDAWAWRIPFFAGGVVAAIGLFVRLRLDESPAFLRLRAAHEPAHEPDDDPTNTDTRRNWLLLFGIVFGLTLYGYTATSFPAFLSGVTGLPLADALTTNVIALAIEVPLIVLAGAASDRFGRKPLMVGAVAVFVVATIPIFLLVTTSGFVGVLLGQVLFVALYATVSGPSAAMYTELFPTRVRSSAFSSAYNLSIALFGGTAPFVNTFLATRIGTAVAPAYYLTFGALVSLALLLVTRDRHAEELR
ncbi:MFS transporter [Pseudonocardia acaciae]|uniref:MFS transporter n=1 Tax=Pseudonocardia acaciae TaxID=551276 RepID=UPI001FDEF073|nr:MFS transporter [Pseudonocardia acaciae]